jgi:hypothetical protein
VIHADDRGNTRQRLQSSRNDTVMRAEIDGRLELAMDGTQPFQKIIGDPLQ